ASLLGLLRGNGPAWRQYLDLEHGVCYSLENNWTGLTDGRMKYIFHAYHGNEQLFDLTADPYETRDLSSSTAHEATLRLWRQRMVQHLEPRGDVWVKGGKLQIRREPIPRSPNFPVSKT
ncbi:MAG: arylsulfatase, partial [Bryobacterales bacterium]|nr:arylsulfatase [Bryobacterales bacterium]